MYKLVVTTDLDRLSGEAKKYAIRRLHELSYSHNVQVYRVPPYTRVTEDLFRDCDAVIMRPTDYVSLSPDLFVHARERVLLVTVSEGQAHLKKFVGNPRFKIVSLPPDASNDRGVAALNLTLAHMLLCRMPINLNNVDLKRFQCTTEQTNLVGKNWLLLGAGKQARKMIELGRMTGLSSFYVWNTPMELDHIGRCLGTPDAAERIDQTRWKATLASSGGRALDIHFISDLETCRNEIDIISVHMKLTEEVDEKGRQPTAGLVDADFIGMFDKRPILINTSRGELINETAVWTALKEGRLSGVALDVLFKETERLSDHSESKLWRERVRAQEDTYKDGLIPSTNKLNLIITPHIGGSVDNDNGPMWAFVMGEISRSVSKNA